jgi:hypothetical protein
MPRNRPLRYPMPRRLLIIITLRRMQRHRPLALMRTTRMHLLHLQRLHPLEERA